MPSSLADANVPIPCRCGKKHQQTIGWIQKNKMFTCACGTVIDLETDEFKKTIRKVEKELNNLTKQIKKLGM